jgi:hypothetical protein
MGAPDPAVVRSPARACAMAGGIGPARIQDAGGRLQTGHSDGVHLGTCGGVTVTCIALRGHSASATALRRDATPTSGSALAQGRVLRQTGCTLRAPWRQIPCPARTRWDALERPPQNGPRRQVCRLGWRHLPAHVGIVVKPSRAPDWIARSLISRAAWPAASFGGTSTAVATTTTCDMHHRTHQAPRFSHNPPIPPPPPPLAAALARRTA